MSVVGYDFGNLNSYIAVARQGGIEVLTNDYSLHATPTCVSFGHKSRVMGVAARQQVNSNFRNTVLNFKHLLGRKFSDPIVQLYKKYIPCEIVQSEDDSIGLKVTYCEQTHVLSPEQVAAAFLVKLKQITEHSIGTKVNECVISVPFYFTENQKRALFAAGRIAGLNVLDLVNENTAVGIAYGIYKGSTFPPEKEPPKIVAFVDIGHSSTQASLMAFNDCKVVVLGATHDITVGGLFFDDVIRGHFSQQFQREFKVDAQKNPRAWLRLLDECEKLKKQMSANSTAIPIGIECFMDDKDVSGKMQRSEFEELAAPLFEKIRNLLAKLIEQTGIQIESIAEVELIGGSSRIPFIKQIVAHFFNREPKTTMNLDEAVVRGAGMQCAILSPSCRIKEFKVGELPKEPAGEEKSTTAGENEPVPTGDSEPTPTAECGLTPAGEVEPSYNINIEEFLKVETEMQRRDLNEKLKADAKNAVEEYCYGMRDRVVESLASSLPQEEVEKFLALLSGTEEWLYNEGEDVERAAYEKKLSELKANAYALEAPIRKRQRELEEKQKKEAEAIAKAEAEAAARAEAANGSAEAAPTANTEDDELKQQQGHCQSEPMETN